MKEQERSYSHLNEMRKGPMENEVLVQRWEEKELRCVNMNILYAMHTQTDMSTRIFILYTWTW